MASLMSFSTSSALEPAATQPGRSGEYAEKESPSPSMTIKYSLIVAGLPGDLLSF